ncbi:hypothetical protein [Silvibacterium dinghuense]|uniref:Uncharacterized protein n=1 Tax=Silvibacterium dinghuense TaxID=1560006 RepID=A0A4Q1SBL9_9BACT|nr:hypothetical protein [Silvibacterium dinghuense]RXS94531.1 hypothetical protein ESZ00_15810 [Silvibacterium dinghuense]
MSRRTALCLVLLPASAMLAKAQMVSPEIDLPGSPFSYFSKPVDVIGVMNAPSATEITPEGFLYSGYGELMFFTGPEQTPLVERIRTLKDGYVPIIEGTVRQLGIDYTFTTFAAEVPVQTAVDPDHAPGQIVNFVRVTLHNPGTTPRAAFLTTAMRYQAPQTTTEALADNRFRRPVTAERVGDYQQPGEAFDPKWSYRIGDGACERQDRVLYFYPQKPRPELALTLHTHYNRVGPLDSDKLSGKMELTPATPACRVSYTVPLKPGETVTLDLRMPLIPVKQGSPEAQQALAASYDVAYQHTVDYWHAMIARGMGINVPEAKAVDTFRASLMYDLLYRNMVDGQYVQTASQFQYHRFYLRDSADYMRMYDATGYADIGGQIARFFLTRQQPDGNFLSQPQQYDGWGEALWAFGEHFRRTRDMDFARLVYPHVVKAVDWLIAARMKDPLHVMPASDVRDNEYVAGHLTGYNFLALDGLQGAITLAHALGHEDDAARFQHEYDDYRATFFALLSKASKEEGGIIPPSLDAGAWKGTDWGNLLSVTPEPVLDPFDPRVTATLHSTQARYQEGITTYAEPDDGIFLHHYLTIKNTLTELVRGEDHQAIRELYAELLHTSSTQAGFEYAIRPWGSRDFEGNLSPHGWFAADYRNLLRNMMVREQGDSLHLLSAVSPEWIGAGKEIRVTHAPTYFGSLDFTLRETGANTAELTIESAFTHAPEALVLHIPWFRKLDSATADGVAVQAEADGLHLPAGTRVVRLKWQAAGDPHMSYERTVESWKQEYQRRWNLFLTDGQGSSMPDTWRVPE